METDGEGRPIIRGVAVRYGSTSMVLKDAKGRPFREKFRAGAFSRALATGADVRVLINHDRNLVMGRTSVGTAKLIDDPDALRFEAYPPKTAITDHYLSSISRGDMDGVSFRFYKKSDNWSGAGEATVREVTEADIDDVSVCTYPAYLDTFAGATRSYDEHCQSLARDPRLAKAKRWLRLVEAESQ
jgi:HK97 family phage prohead protease